MFTGIVTDIGRITLVEPGGDTRFRIETRYETAAIAIGASIACAGACLTVVDKGPNWFAVSVSKETLDCTNLAQWRIGTRINLERALKVGDELGGHIVSGHIDGVGALEARVAEGYSIRLTVAVPDELARFIAPKGSITLDGTSLTVNEVNGNRFGINVIPHTQGQTTFGDVTEGDLVNVEVDVLARYVARLKEVQAS